MTKKQDVSYLNFFFRLILVFFLLCLGSAFSLFGQTRIMALGDSITGSPGCWRALLYQMLMENGYTNVDFVGTQYPQGCGFPYDGEHEGHGGALATNVAAQNELVGWLSASKPEIVLMHFGTNDIWSGRANSVILDAFTKLVGQMRAHNPNMKILVARIIPMDSARSCSTCAQGVITLNNTLPSWASGLSTPASPVYIVDQWTGFNVTADTYDGVHPNSTGDQKMARGWYPALTSLLVGGTGVTPTPVVTAIPTPAPTPETVKCLLSGDADGNGQVSIVDALMTAQFYVGLNPPNFANACADVNCDGRITIVDALMIAQFYVGLITNFGC